jgi:hypothetical protein
MIDLLHELRSRNEALFLFGMACLAFAGVCLALSAITTTQVFNVSAWIKPFKFAFSTWLFAWAMGWYMHYLPGFDPRYYNWTFIALLSFEIGYIAWRAAQGQLSHFNVSTPANGTLYSLMAGAITIVTLYTAYIGLLFFGSRVAPLEPHYLWAIRLGIMLFVLFAFEGFVMGSRLTHTVGGPDGTPGLPLLHWSYTHGDLRIAHFAGMHALQLLPLLSYYFIRNTKGTIILAVVYGLLAVAVLVLALNGRPLIKRNTPQQAADAQVRDRW